MSSRRTLITGAAGGMGRAVARRFAARGDSLLLIDVMSEPLDALCTQLGSAARAQVCDISDPEAVSALFARVADEGSLAAIVHTAGLSPSMSDWRSIMSVNYVGTARLLDALGPLVEPGGAAVCISSNSSYLIPAIPSVSELLREALAPDLLERLAALREVPEWSSALAYGLSKHGVRELVARLAAPWGARGARIVSLSPGITDTPMGRREYEHQPVMHEMSKLTPAGRDATPEDIADVVEFLCSGSASYISGSDVLVDGGQTAALGAIPK
jgi:NAD(P)-dependent dehydrogenase (short-subunit alcohol dehydrogenase family)